MKWKFFYLTLFLFLTNLSTEAQDNKDYRLMLKSGTFTPAKNIAPDKTTLPSLRLAAQGQKSFVIIQFESIPTAEEKRQLKSEGIELLEYIPNNAYTATVTGQDFQNSLARTKGRAIIELSPEQKMQPGLANGRMPAHAIKAPGTLDVWISYPASIGFEEIRDSLKAQGFELLSEQYKMHQILALRIPQTRLKELAGKRFIQYVQAIPPDNKAFNNKTTSNARANLLSSSMPAGRNLSGEGVVVGVGDDSNPLQHVDFNGRMINRAAIEAGVHGVHVMGTLAGAGIMNERYTGFAPKATYVAQSFSNILAYAPEYSRDFGMVVTNNSYGGDINTCETFGVYDLYAYILDRQAFQLPYLQHVFAAGNSGAVNCSPYPAGFANILSGYQTAKNVMCVGNTSEVAAIASTSSRGPLRDGRIKPEITAQGTSVMSTIPVNLYGSGSGTSMSSPAVAGGLTLLYQRYRQLHGNANPKNGLMKALVLNGAVDKGNEGPDYRYGFGWLNLLRPLKMLESNSYVNDSLAHQQTKEISIPIPPNTAQLKVMLYWNDPAGAILSAQNLVHDLDLKVVTPNSTTVLPRLLDPTPSNVNNVATTGVDNINNIEQVVINNPGEGNYKISVKGSSVAQNPLQEYFIVYDIIPNSLELTYPVGNERLREGDAQYIHWDAFGNTTSTFTVQLSLNAGGSWSTLGNNLAAGTRQMLWTVAAGTITDNARVRVIQNSTGEQRVSGDFTIVGIPTLTLSSLQCEGYISLDWTAVSGATDYEVMILKGTEMVSAGTTNSTNFVLSGLSKDSTYICSVRARLNGHPGRRAVSISRKPDSGTCQGNISNKDYKIESILTPASSGRVGTSTALGNPVFVKIRIKNLDDVDLNEPLDVGYELNGTAIPVETITPFIEKGKTYDHTFSVGANLSSPGTYTFKVYIHHQNDVVSANDTLTKTFRQLPNDQIALPFLDDLEYLTSQSVTTTQIGLQGDGRYDFSASSDAGRVRSFVNSGLAYSGQKALTLDANRYNSGGNTSYLDATFNLSAYDIENADVRLNFRYKNHGQKANANNKVWIRGKDTDPWIEAYDLFANQNLPQDGYKTPRGIELSNLLSASNKNFSSSFQVRFGQWGKMITADYATGAGYSFDDIEIYTVVNDIQMLALVSPVPESCGLGFQEPVTIRIRNSSSQTVTNIPVVFSVNGVEVQEVIPSIERRTTIDYTFNGKATFTTFGEQHVNAWVALPSDGYHDNDTVSVLVNNAPVVTTFPYLEDFEANNGYWFPKGVNSSWAYGTPVSATVNTAASGKKIWKTNLSGGHNDREESYLYSPCFTVNELQNPTLSFSVSLDLEVCDPTPCDYVFVEYSGDGGAWTRLGSEGEGFNWYNRTYSGKGAWSVNDNTRWHVATIGLPTGFTNLKIRFGLISDGFTHGEGIGLDDIHIYNKVSNIYDGPTMAAPVTQTVSPGQGWVNFLQNNQLIASVNPKTQNPGNTDVQAFINTSGIRNANSQYYLDRNVTIKPVTYNLLDSALVRLYFLDAENEALLKATGCAACGKPANAYELGVAKFQGKDQSKEDGLTTNDTDGTWLFYAPSQIRIVPYDKGYYAELKVKDFSEFWLAKGILGTSSALPVNLVSFDARKKVGEGSGQDVLLDWVTSSEENFDHFEIEIAAGNDAYRQGLFTTLTQIDGKGGLNKNGRYNFTDQQPGKFGTRYYRLKVVDADSSFVYSRVRPVVFDETLAWTVYPNPSKGMFFVNYQADAGKEIGVNIYGLNGQVFQKSHFTATGFPQNSKVDLSSPEFALGLYVVEIVDGKEKQVFQVVKD
ncbi:S8 family serine peptidase [Dyadobacter luticola]|uniref:T9SS type A sorting domain-containing protein n=1 Tax=Dyadobacter luticola TaxID=1979387 RepID=A0A5R9KWR0_9BACT|nr:S8 family serine peptidase [Dyadobacter luticola]TLV00527.1 T9SS type A sorting domain-containing protein [Dyadobacter luticola]